MKSGRFWFRVGVIALLTWLSLHVMRPLNLFYYGLNPGPMHGINLVFHEAGHVLLCWTPRFIYVLGGTLGQIAMPLAIAIAFIVKRRWFDSGACFWWVGQSVTDCAPYIADARSLRLPLITGYTGAEADGHDWEYLLGTLDVAPYDQGIAAVFLNVGRGVMIVALVGCAAIAAWDMLRKCDDS